MRWIILAIIVAPVIELSVLLYFGYTFGLLPTIVIVLLTGLIGVYLAKRQGLKAIKEIQYQMQNHQLPSEAVIDGVCVFIGGLLLLTPGLLSDLIGFLLLFKITRNIIKPIIYKWFRKKMKNGQVIVMKRADDF